ncbi:KamA family radical SAM protein [Caldicellulosiruptoraceae bacterium PP1]
MIKNEVESRFYRLKAEIDDYLSIVNKIKTGLDEKDKIEYQKRKILKLLGATQNDWSNYKWQIANRFSNPHSFKDIIGLNTQEVIDIENVSKRYRFAVSPYYLSLIEPNNENCPIRMQSIPSIKELNDEGELDPMNEAETSPTEIITQRYPDRLIVKVTNVCGMFCRFCQRRRLIGEIDKHASKESIIEAIEYIRQNKNIRDVLITGGDSFLLSDSEIEWILKELRSIKHVEIIRFGTRTPVTLPQRITNELVSILNKYHPIYVNTHFNHPKEITQDSQRAIEMLADAGIPLGNQMVLLKGINNDNFIVRKLNQELLKIRVKPYYIFHPKRVKGTSHFWLSIQEGLEIMESLRGRTSGMAVPTYILNAPKGMGKTPLLPNYLLYIGKGRAVLRNWQGKMFEIEN